MMMEGGLRKPTRFDIDWKNKDYLDEDLFEKELILLEIHVEKGVPFFWKVSP